MTDLSFVFMVPVFLVCFGVCVVYMGQVPEIQLMYVCMYNTYVFATCMQKVVTER